MRFNNNVVIKTHRYFFFIFYFFYINYTQSRYIQPGTLIISDGWRAYNRLDEIDGGIYEHQVIVHQQNFVDPVHTQNVENMWMRAKRKLRRQFGTSEDLFPSYLHEFLWRNRFQNNNLFGAFLACVTQQYPV
jgi:transposase-like protein